MCPHLTMNGRVLSQYFRNVFFYSTSYCFINYRIVVRSGTIFLYSLCDVSPNAKILKGIKSVRQFYEN
jgi:hypothetical protein